MSPKKYLLNGEVGYTKARMFNRNCVKMWMDNGEIHYKTFVGYWDNHTTNGKVIIERPDGTFTFYPTTRYLYPRINNIFSQFMIQKTWSQLKSFSSWCWYYKVGKNIKLRLMHLNCNKTFNVPSTGIVNFDSKCMPIGLDEYIPRERGNTRESVW